MKKPMDPTIERAVRMEQFSFQDGIYTRNLGEDISYPDDGNDLCFQLEADSFWFRHRNDVIQAGVDRYPAGVIFDIGGGNGYVAQRLEAQGHPCALFEPGRDGAANAKSRGLGYVFCSLFDEEVIRPGTVSGAGLFDVLEHIEDDATFLSMLYSRLSDGGRVYITVPAYAWLWSREDDEAGHFRRYTRKSLLAVLADTGFTIEYATYFFWFLPLPILIFRRLLGLGQSTEAPGPQDVLDRAQKAHHMPGFLARVAGWVMRAETRWIARGRRVPFGGSLFMVARR